MATLNYLTSDGTYEEVAGGDHDHAEYVKLTGDITSGRLAINSTRVGRVWNSQYYGIQRGDANGGYGPAVLLGSVGWTHRNWLWLIAGPNGNIYFRRPGRVSYIDTEGALRTNGEICGYGVRGNRGQFRVTNGNAGFMLRSDGSDFYMLNTGWGSPFGEWTGYRPFRHNFSSGDTFMGSHGNGGGLWVRGSTGYLGSSGVHNNTTTNGGNVRVVAGGHIGRYSSSYVKKFDIRTLNSRPSPQIPYSRTSQALTHPEAEPDVDVMRNLSVVTYVSDLPADVKTPAVGLLAEDVQNSAPYLLDDNKTPDPVSVAAGSLALLQKASDKLASMRQRLDDLEQSWPL